MPVTPEASNPEPGEGVEKVETSTADGDNRGRFGYGRPAHGSEPGAQYKFGEPQEREPKMPGDRREIYRSSNGDCWFLVRDPKTDHGIVIHEPNQSSGGKPTFIAISDFLLPGSDGPEHQALLRLIGTLAEDPSDTP
jgi:hypothetical protein